MIATWGVVPKTLYGHVYWQVVTPDGKRKGLYGYKKNATRAMRRMVELEKSMARSDRIGTSMRQMQDAFEDGREYGRKLARWEAWDEQKSIGQTPWGKANTYETHVAKSMFLQGIAQAFRDAGVRELLLGADE
jgi:hypothetical protein